MYCFICLILHASIYLRISVASCSAKSKISLDMSIWMVKSLVIWDMMLYCWVSGYQHYEGAKCLHLQGQTPQVPDCSLIDTVSYTRRLESSAVLWTPRMSCAIVIVAAEREETAGGTVSRLIADSCWRRRESETSIKAQNQAWSNNCWPWGETTARSAAKARDGSQ